VLALVAGCHRAVSVGSGAAPTPAGAARSTNVNALPADITPAMLALGDSLFNNGSCQRCHGKGGVGAQNAPNLTDSQWLQITGKYDEIVKVITDGVPRTAIKDSTHQRAMNPRGGPMNLTDPQIRAIAAYVFRLSHH
jgi:mono/diheme cytochrome c family protein